MRLQPFQAILTILLSLWAAIAQSNAMPRLPRTVFDVIPPSDRVQGTRGNMILYQPACRVGTTNESRRRIVDVAMQEWAFFGFQTIDASRPEDRVLPEDLVPDRLNPKLPEPRIMGAALRLGMFDDDAAADSTIAGYWSATPDGGSVIAAQNAAWNAPGGEVVNWVEPWSAAFVSWVMCEAGLGDLAQFRNRAIASDSSGCAFWQYRMRAEFT